MIKTSLVSKTYGTGRGAVEALRDVSITITKGERLGILGPSGSGKSTLLNILGLLDHDFSGEILLDGEPCHRLTRKRAAQIRGAKIGFVVQSFALVKYWSVLQNVMLPLQYSGVPRGVRLARCRNLLDELGIGHKARSIPSELSVGETQRVAIARALVNDPAIVLADEPTGSLDSGNSGMVIELLVRYCEDRNATLVLITHSADIARYCSRRVSIVDGELTQE